MEAKEKNYFLPSVDDITEKSRRIFKVIPEEITEKVQGKLKQRMIIPPAPQIARPQEKKIIPPTQQPASKKKSVAKTKAGFTQSNEYESLLSEIKPDAVYNDLQMVRHEAKASTESYFLNDDISITQQDRSVRANNRKSFFQKIKTVLGMIKFQHSIFALPFALMTLFVATQGKPGWGSFVLIVLAMIFARNAAMTFNRIVDRHMDKENPRTRDRVIATGDLSLTFAVVFSIINIAAFVIVSAFFNTSTLILSPLALLIILGYSLTKRVTCYTQFYLGLALGCAPVGAWIAMTGTLALFPILIGLAVLFWVAGFDIIYATLDYEFDKKHKIKSIVVKFGLPQALTLSKMVHILSVLLFIFAGLMQGMHLFYYLGCLLTTLLLIYEHRLVKPHDLSRVNTAFFTLNGYVSVLFFAFVLLDIYLF